MRLVFIVMLGANVACTVRMLYLVAQQLAEADPTSAVACFLVMLLNVAAAFFCFASLRTLRARQQSDRGW